MTRNVVAPETAQRNREEGNGYTFHALIPDDFEGIAFSIAALRIGDHAHLDIDSGRAVNSGKPQQGPRVTRGHAGRLILRWHEWEVLREILDSADCVHIAEVERPTQGQIKRHTGKSAEILTSENDTTKPDYPRPSSVPAEGVVAPFDAGWEAHAVGLERKTVEIFSPDPEWALLGWDTRALIESKQT